MATAKKRIDWSPVVKEEAKDSVRLQSSFFKITKSLLDQSGMISKTPDVLIQAYANKLEYVREWFNCYENRDQGPSINAMKAALDSVKSKTEALGKCMKEIDSRH